MVADNSNFALCCFDLDGTLVTGTTVCLHLATSPEHLQALTDLEHRYAAGEISNQQVAQQDAAFHEGRTRADVWGRLGSIPTIHGIGETLDWIRERGMHPLLATVTWSLAAEFFRDRYGFAATTGCKLKEEAGVFVGTVEKHIEAEDKVRFVRDYAGSRGWSLDRCVAVGDSRSDIPLFEAAGISIALNATEAAKRAADVSVDTDDLTDIIPVIR